LRALELLIVGCGKMGGWFARHLTGMGHSLELYDVNRQAAEGLASEVGGKALRDLSESSGGRGVIVAVPISASKGVLRELGSRPGDWRFVVEIAALKGPVAAEVRRLRRKGMTVVMLHPLFGPTTRNLMGAKVAHVEPGDEERERTVIEQLLPGADVIRIGLREHDAAVRYSIALTHFIGLAAASLLSRSMVRTLPTNSMGVLMRLVEIALSEPESFYRDELMRSPSSEKVMRAFLREGERLLGLLGQGSLDKTLRRLREVQDELVGF
jgi:prephenate dehydrogenase